MAWLEIKIRKEGLKIITLLLMLILSACVEVEENPISDPCFEGFYSDGSISLHVIHNRGTVAASGWKIHDDAALWDSLYFNGSIMGPGEARGELKINFYDGDILTETDPDVRLIIPASGSCDVRTPLNFSFSYFWEGTTHSEPYSLAREPGT